MGFRNMRRGAAALLTTTALAAGAPIPAWAQEAVTGGEEAEVDARGQVGPREIVVTGRSLETEENALPVQVLAGDELAHRREGGLG